MLLIFPPCPRPQWVWNAAVLTPGVHPAVGAALGSWRGGWAATVWERSCVSSLARREANKVCSLPGGGGSLPPTLLLCLRRPLPLAPSEAKGCLREAPQGSLRGWDSPSASCFSSPLLGRLGGIGQPLGIRPWCSRSHPCPWAPVGSGGTVAPPGLEGAAGGAGEAVTPSRTAKPGRLPRLGWEVSEAPVCEVRTWDCPWVRRTLLHFIM